MAHLVIRHPSLDGHGHNVAGVVAEADGAWVHDINAILARGFGIRIAGADKGRPRTAPFLGAMPLSMR